MRREYSIYIKHNSISVPVWVHGALCGASLRWRCSQAQQPLRFMLGVRSSASGHASGKAIVRKGSFHQLRASCKVKVPRIELHHSPAHRRPVGEPCPRSNKHSLYIHVHACPVSLLRPYSGRSTYIHTLTHVNQSIRTRRLVS